MLYKTRKLTGVAPSSPPLAPLTGGKIGKADRVGSIFATQDTILSHGRRIVARVGLEGSDTFQVPSTTTTSASQTYPLRTVNRVACRASCKVTPGHFLRCVAVYVPAGASQKFTAPNWVYAGAGGSIVVTITYENGITTEAVTQEIDCEASPNVNNGETTTAGASWAEARRARTEPFRPTIVTQADAVDWTDDVTAKITIAYKGGVRVLSCIVYEEPIAYVTDTTSVDWASSQYTDGSGLPLASYPTRWPVVRTFLGGDPSGGTYFLINTAARQAADLGGVYATQSTWREASLAVSATEAAPLTTTSTATLGVDLWRTAITGWSAGVAGWSVSSGANAPQWNTSGPHLELRDTDRVVPVRLRVYGMVSGGTGTLRLYADTFSVAELVITSTSYDWYETTGHLRCGFGPEDETNLVLLGRVNSGVNTLSVRYVMIEYDNV